MSKKWIISNGEISNVDNRPKDKQIHMRKT